MTSPWYEWIDVGARYGPEMPGYVHKFQRAVTHLNAITQEAGDFISAGLHAPIGAKLEAGEDGWIILIPGPTNPVPGTLAVYLGDFLTNARACLDYLVYDLVRANKKDPGTHTAFPIFDSLAKWRENISERDRETIGTAPTDGLAEDVLSIILEEQPLRYRSHKARQKDPLMHLLRMSNADKHRRLHVAAIETGEVVNVWAEPEGLFEILRWKPAKISGPVEGEREVARLKGAPVVGADPNADVYFGFRRSAQIAFSGPGETWKATLNDLFGIVNSIMKIGRRLESHVKPPTTWFDDLFAGRIGGGHRLPPS